MRRQLGRGVSRTLTDSLDSPTVSRLLAREDLASWPGARPIADDFQPVYNLGDDLGGDGFRVDGAAGNDFAGYSISSIGDVNGDGIGDFAVGAPFHDETAAYNGGAVYVIFGKPGRDAIGDLDFADLRPEDGFTVFGVADHQNLGERVGNGGDIDGDGFGDILLAAPGVDGGSPYSGAIVVIYGRAAFDESYQIDDLDPADGEVVVAPNEQRFDTDITFYASEEEILANINALVGVIDDAIANDPGGMLGLLLTHGGAPRPVDGGEIESANIVFRITGDAPYDYAGCAIATADVNGDGFEDIVIGANGNDAGGSNAGAAYVIFGSAAGFADSDLTGLESRPAEGFKLVGDAPGDYAGTSVANAGDFNGDGIDDIIIGAPLNEDGGVFAGKAYVIYGRTSGFGTIALGALGAAGFAIQGNDASDQAGRDVSSAGDVNGDGFDDIIIGARGANFYAGSAYVIFGRAAASGDIDLSNLAAADGFRIDGANSQDQAGRSVSGGDINGDGFADILVGATGVDGPAGDFRATAGAAFVIYGVAPKSAVNRTGAAGDQVIRGGKFDDTLSGLGGADSLLGGKGGDLLNGGSGGDILTGGGGANTLAGAGGNDKLVGGADADRLNGGAGSDTLQGGGGSDRYLFDLIEPGAVDRILGFQHNIDEIALDAATFGLPAGALSPGRFVIGNQALDANDRVIYRSDGKLYFDPDGTGAQAKTLIAVLTGAPVLTAIDFIVI